MLILKNNPYFQYYPIEYIGLLPPSLVTTEVTLIREDLADKYEENYYYQQKFHSLLNNGYPMALETSFINEAKAVLEIASTNIQILMQTHDGAADCFTFPDKCEIIRDNIYSKLQKISKSDLLFLENIKYNDRLRLWLCQSIQYRELELMEYILS